MTGSNNNGNSKLRIVLFDFDGTLVNTTPLILRSFHATWLKVFGFTLADEDYIATFGTLIHSAFKNLMRLSIERGLMPEPADPVASLEEMADRLLPVYRVFNLGWHDEMIEPFPQIDRTLEALDGAGWLLGVVSSKMRAGVERGMNIFGMAGRFDVIVGAEDVSNHKPHPEPLLRAMEMLGGSAGETIYIGDSTHDIIAGHAAGTLTAAATWGPFARSELVKQRPHFLLESPAEILDVVGLR